jgi:hypothetical protein
MRLYNMKTNFIHGLLFVVTFVLIISTPVQANEFVDVSNKAPKLIARFNVDTLILYHRDGTRFNRIGEVSATELPVLPIPILETSSAGYVLISGNAGQVWLDEYDISTTDVPLVTATCDDVAHGKPSDSVNKSVPGNIEGCK